jgi:C1A family cysteine protease
MPKTLIGGFGWKQDRPDKRDYVFTVPEEVVSTLPLAVDLRGGCPPVYDQGKIGSCTANAIAGAIQYDRIKSAQKPPFIPSRLFIYYNERSIEFDVKIDGGASLRTGLKTVCQQGVCPEEDWPYIATPPLSDGGPFPPGSPPVTQPPQACYDEAVKYTVKSYASLKKDLNQLKGCLASGFPFIFGFNLFSNWVGAAPMPTVIPLPPASGAAKGGHAVLCVGYDETNKWFIIRNSWGATARDGTPIGDAGYFYMPYDYIASRANCADFWVINAMAA